MGSPVRKYRVVKDGHETILKLNDSDVKLYPEAEPVDVQDSKADDGDDVKPAAKTRTPSDKSRRASSDK